MSSSVQVGVDGTVEDDVLTERVVRAAVVGVPHDQRQGVDDGLMRVVVGSELRHSALTHLAEDGVNLPLLMAKSGHESLRSLQKYARPGAEAIAAMTAAHDPARRRRHGA